MIPYEPIYQVYTFTHIPYPAHQMGLTVQLASPAISDGLCAHRPNPNRNELEKWQKLLSERILGAGQEYRLNIDKLLEEMNQGNGFGENGKICKLTHIPQ